MSPAELTLKFFREIDYEIAIVEQTIHATRPGGHRFVFKRDAFGFMDGIAYRPGPHPSVLALQWTVGDRFADHVETCLRIDGERKWTTASVRRLLVFGWRMVGPAGHRKVYQARVAEIAAPWGAQPRYYDGPKDELAKALGLVDG